MLGAFFLFLGSQWGLYVNPALVCMFQIDRSQLFGFFFRKRNYPDLQWGNWPVESDPQGIMGGKKPQKHRSGLKWKGSLLKKAQGSMPCPSSPWRQDIQAFSSPWKVVSRDIFISPNLYHPCPTLLAIISDFRKLLLPWPHLATLLLPVSDEQLETCVCIRAEE